MAFYSKEQQTRPKNGKKMSKQKANSTWGFKKPIKAKPRKTKKNETIDKEYSAWLGTQPCIISGKYAKRGVGANNMHCHHIKADLFYARYKALKEKGEI